MTEPITPKTARFQISPSRLGLGLALLVAFLAFAHCVVFGVRWYFDLDADDMLGFLRFFDMGSEANLPAYISALNLLFAALLLFVIARHDRQTRGRVPWAWGGLAVGFVVLSFDEAAQIHEGLIGLIFIALFPELKTGSYVWFVPYLPVLAVLAIIYVPWVWKLPRRYATLFLLAAGIYLGGAVGVEAIEGFAAKRLPDNANFGLLAISRMVEETAEMIGVVLGIYALLRYIADHHIRVGLNFEGGAEGVGLSDRLSPDPESYPAAADGGLSVDKTAESGQLGSARAPQADARSRPAVTPDAGVGSSWPERTPRHASRAG